MALHEKGKGFLKQKMYAEALVLLLEADREFRFGCFTPPAQLWANYKLKNYLGFVLQTCAKCMQILKSLSVSLSVCNRLGASLHFELTTSTEFQQPDKWAHNKNICDRAEFQKSKRNTWQAFEKSKNKRQMYGAPRFYSKDLMSVILCFWCTALKPGYYNY